MAGWNGRCHPQRLHSLKLRPVNSHLALTLNPRPRPSTSTRHTGHATHLNLHGLLLPDTNCCWTVIDRRPSMWEADSSWYGAPLLDRRAPDATQPYVSITTATRPTHATDDRYQHCPSYKLPKFGTIEISPGNTIYLDENAVFRPLCTNAATSQDDGTGGITSVADMRDPFHASITPQAYATGAATVIAWMLVIMLIITPRTFFVGNASGRSGLMGRRGMISGATGGGSIIGVGSRPWLQKAAALTVAISLTLATADTFKIARIARRGRRIFLRPHRHRETDDSPL